MQLSRKDIGDKLKEILVGADEKYKSIVDKITEDSVLTTDIGLNSIGMLYLVIIIEESFGIQFENIGIDDFKTFGDMVNYIESHSK